MNIFSAGNITFGLVFMFILVLYFTLPKNNENIDALGGLAIVMGLIITLGVIFGLINIPKSNNGGECNIKGNISQSTGEKIYHMPDQKYYYITNINTEYGEKWFCSEQDAVKAGWRKSYQ